MDRTDFLTVLNMARDLGDHFLFKTLATFLLGGITWCLGGLDLPLLALMVLYLTDFALGLFLAVRQGSYSGRRFRRGLGKFLLYCVVIMAAHMLDLALQKPLPFLAEPIRDFLVLFIAVNEFLSVCTHLHALGMRLPVRFISKLKSYRDHLDCPEIGTGEKKMKGVGKLLKIVGEGVLSFVPGGRFALDALEGVGAVADAIGGDTGAKIKNGISQLTEGLQEVDRLPPEAKAKAVEAKYLHEERMAEIDYKDKKLDYDDQAHAREQVIKTALQSDDPLVRQARPKMMILLGKACVAFAFLAPGSLLLAAGLDVPADALAPAKELMVWTGGFLFSSFTASFTGYTVARTADKRTASGLPVGKILGMAANLGRKIM